MLIIGAFCCFELKVCDLFQNVHVISQSVNIKILREGNPIKCLHSDTVEAEKYPFRLYSIAVATGDIICLISLPQDTATVVNIAIGGETGRKYPRRRGNKCMLNRTVPEILLSVLVLIWLESIVMFN